MDRPEAVKYYLHMAGRIGKEVYKDPRWRRVRAEVMERDGGRCACGDFAFEVHHIKPLAKGGEPFDPSNLRAICRPCHLEAHGGDSDWDVLLRETRLRWA